MRAKRILCTLIAVMMTAAVFGVHVTVAEAEEITVVTAAMSPEPGDLAVVGSMIAYPLFSTTSTGSALVEGLSADWERNGVDVDDGSFFEGTWRLWVPVVIDGGLFPTDTLSDSVKLIVNGIEWKLDHVTHADSEDPDEVAWFYYPNDFVLTGGPLTFVKSYEWDIPQTVKGVPITPIDVSSGVGGGKKPYKFTKLYGPSWISVSEDGIITGTNSSYGINQMLGIQVTDDNGDTATITLDVDLTKKDDREDIGYIEVSWPEMAGMLSAGKTVSSGGLTVNYPDTVKIQSGYWEKYDDESYGFIKVEDGETFGPGAYRFHLSVYADGEKYLMTAPELKVDTFPWNLDETWSTLGREGADFSSDAFDIYQTLHTVVVSGVTPPVSGSPLTLDGIGISTEGAYINVAHWMRYDSEKDDYLVCDGLTAEDSVTYYLDLDIRTRDYYIVDSSVYVNVGGYHPPTVQTVYLGSDHIFVRCPIQAAESSNKLYVVTAGSLNVRAGASSSSQRVGGLVYGDGVKALAVSGQWVLVQHGSVTGWVPREYLALTYSEETAIKPTWYTVTAGALNVRSGPATSYERIGGYTEGKKVLITGRLMDGENNEWLVTDYLDQVGFMMAKYTEGESAEMDTGIVKFSLDFDFPTSPSDEINYAVATGDSVSLTDQNFTDEGSGVFSVAIYPDDARNFRSLTAADITLPEGIGLKIVQMFLETDGSIRLWLAPTDAGKEYSLAEAPGDTWTKESGKDMALTLKSNIGDEYTFSLFSGLFMDGAEVDPACYTASAGSLRLLLKAEYLDTLSPGDHVLEVKFEDASVRIPFRVAAAPPAGGSTQPDTGVGSNMLLYMMLLVFCALCAVKAMSERKKTPER